MDDDSCAWFCRYPSGARVVSAVTDSGFSCLFGMPAVQTCGVDIDDENQGKSWNEGVKNGRDSTISKFGRGRWNAGGGRKGEEDERRLGLMCDCMMRDAAIIVGRLSSPARRRR